MFYFGFSTGSFIVVNSDNMEEVISFHHRKEEISDIKFSPGKPMLYMFLSDMLVDVDLLISHCMGLIFVRSYIHEECVLTDFYHKTVVEFYIEMNF